MNTASPVKATKNTEDTFHIIHSPLYTRLDTFFKNKHRLQGFNGSVILSKGGRVYYLGNFGYENFSTKDTITQESSFQIASVSKTFTATAILYLVENGKLNLTDPLEKFFPDIPYKNITIQNLLCHRSGLPNYLHFGDVCWKDKSKYMTNGDLIKILFQNPKLPNTGKPNTYFNYCNTNYALLASVIEKVSGNRYPDFMRETFFEPLGMNETWVYDVTNPNQKKSAISYNSKWVKQPDDPYDGVYGDKGIYSSSSDMLKWDMSFYKQLFIHFDTQKEAYTPRSFERKGTRNYGYGWRLMKQPNNNYLVYHNGWWHGNNTVFYRYIPDTFSLIILSNKYNRGVYDVQPIFNLINQTSGSTPQTPTEEE